ncbi:MAG: outer membrane protein assembly factor BamB family protein, partial [Planctomycetota bacterium]
KMLQSKWLLMVGLLILGTMLGCATERDEVPVPEPPAWQRLISPELLAQADLEIVWEDKLPIARGEQLERLSIVGDRIYALSSHNYMFSLDRNKGNVKFSGSLAPAALTVLGLDVYEGELITLIGNRLVEISAEFGTELRSKGLDFGVTCPAARNSTHFYLGGADKRLRVLRAKDKVNLFEVAVDENITSIIADDRLVVFATEGGSVTAMAPDKPLQLWQFNAGDGIVGPVVRDGETLYVVSKDTYIYKLDVREGTVPLWKHQTGAILDISARVASESVYQYVPYKGLSAIDKDSGKLIWQLPEGLDLLAEANKRAYVITDHGKLVVMDNNKAKRLYSIDPETVSKYASNTTDSRIYVGDDTGRVVCLRPED